jgi:hypothetical protein
MSIAEMSMNDKVALLKELYHEIAGKGQDGDTMLAHINPEEALLLKAHGGSGTINPNTGLPEYKKTIKTAVKVAAVAAAVYYGGPAMMANPGTFMQGAGLLTSVAGNIQSQKYQKQQAGYQREQVTQQNKAEEARNRYNQLLQKRSRLSSIRQGRIQQGQIEGSMGALGSGGTSSYTGAIGSIGTQTSANLGNINVAQDVGNQITGFNVAAANAGSQANTAGSKSSMWNNVSTLGGTFLEQGGNIASIFGKS